MNQFKRAQVVMLPTEKQSHLFRYSDNILQFQPGLQYGYSPIKAQHLYVISDDKIKEGDYIYHLDVCDITKAEYDGNVLSKSFKKIIATTDTSLSYIKHDDTVPYPKGEQIRLPQPSQQFIEKYVESYNAGKIITDVLVEYDYCPNRHNKGDLSKYLKINPKDNTITIKKLKDSWNREEHSLNLMYCVSELAAQFGHTPTASEMKKWNDATNLWIEENL